jgi:hypothetical protein
MQVAKKADSLWLLTLSPAIWGLHFLLCYATAAIWCEKVAGGSLAAVRAVIWAYTALALGGIGIIAWIGYRRHSYGAAALPHDDDTPEDRRRFLGFAALLLSALSAVATAYSALAARFFGNCF